LGQFAYRYAYSPSSDSLRNGGTGQDYLVISERQKPAALAFALCDGVSQSFCGDLGAQFIGDALVTWLSVLPTVDDKSTIDRYLREMLAWATLFGQTMIERAELPDDLPEMVRSVAEEARVQGTESMFICGRIDEPCADLPAGRALLAWLGDSRIRLWGSHAPDPQTLRSTLLVQERWSSRRGVIGSGPHLYVTNSTTRGLAGLSRMLAYSDGLKSVDEKWHDPVSNLAVSSEIDQMLTQSESDDISYLEIWIGGAPVSGSQSGSSTQVGRVDGAVKTTDNTGVRSARLPVGPGTRGDHRRGPARSRGRIGVARVLVAVALLVLGVVAVTHRGTGESTAPTPTTVATISPTVTRPTPTPVILRVPAGPRVPGRFGP
jgi:hypothetical protein